MLTQTSQMQIWKKALKDFKTEAEYLMLEKKYCYLLLRMMADFKKSELYNKSLHSMSRAQTRNVTNILIFLTDCY